jgi:hypothetical protein
MARKGKETPEDRRNTPSFIEQMKIKVTDSTTDDDVVIVEIPKGTPPPEAIEIKKKKEK